MDIAVEGPSWCDGSHFMTVSGPEPRDEGPHLRLLCRPVAATRDGQAQEGYLARISLSWATSRSESSWLRWKTLRPKIRPVAPASIDWRAFSSMASSPACSPPETRSSVRLADRTTAPMASCEEI